MWLPKTCRLRIVGLYAPFNGTAPYWFGRTYLSSKQGFSVQRDDTGGGVNVTDAFFGGSSGSAKTRNRPSSSASPARSRATPRSWRPMPS